MQSPAHNLVIAVFDDPAGATAAVRALRDAGFTKDHVGLVSHPAKGDETLADAQITPATAYSGATAAGLAGATMGMAPVMPGQSNAGPAGVTFAAIVGYGLLARGITPIFSDSGVPEDEAQYFENEYRDGRSVVIVKPEQRVAEAVQILQAHGGRGKRTPGA